MSIEESVPNAMKIQPFPIIIGIGAPKCGTSWFFEALCRSSEIITSKRKEISYYSSNTKFQRGLNWYLDHFEVEQSQTQPSIHQKYLCEISVTYSYNPSQTAARISKDFPKAQIVLFVRNPADRVRSHVRWLRQLQYGDVVKTKEILDKHPEINAANDYKGIVQSYLKHFSNEQILVIRYESINNNSILTVKNFFDHFGLDHGNLSDIRKEKIGKTIKPRFRFLENLRIKIYKRLTRARNYNTIKFLKNIKIPELYRLLNDSSRKNGEMDYLVSDELQDNEYAGFFDWLRHKKITII